MEHRGSNGDGSRVLRTLKIGNEGRGNRGLLAQGKSRNNIRLFMVPYYCSLFLLSPYLGHPDKENIQEETKHCAKNNTRQDVHPQLLDPIFSPHVDLLH